MLLFSPHQQPKQGTARIGRLAIRAGRAEICLASLSGLRLHTASGERVILTPGSSHEVRYSYHNGGPRCVVVYRITVCALSGQ